MSYFLNNTLFFKFKVIMYKNNFNNIVKLIKIFLLFIFLRKNVYTNNIFDSLNRFKSNKK